MAEAVATTTTSSAASRRAGADVLISARRAGPSGMAIGLDMTEEMQTAVAYAGLA